VQDFDRNVPAGGSLSLQAAYPKPTSIAVSMWKFSLSP